MYVCMYVCVSIDTHTEEPHRLLYTSFVITHLVQKNNLVQEINHCTHRWWMCIQYRKITLQYRQVAFDERTSSGSISSIDLKSLYGIRRLLLWSFGKLACFIVFLRGGGLHWDAMYDQEETEAQSPKKVATSNSSAQLPAVAVGFRTQGSG